MCLKFWNSRAADDSGRDRAEAAAALWETGEEETLARLRNTRRVLVYFVARADVTAVRPADEIDPLYGETLRQVSDKGVETLAYAARVSLDGVELVEPLPVRQGMSPPPTKA